ncbi:glycosyltransferase [Sphingomonas canadensis]|uniref:glycosyltransferase n=1 Tax=Sphingomonas canadensis TaxID=1219257 RepID=UPI003873AB61
MLPAANGGGAERAMIGVAGCLARSGISVEIALVRKTGPFLDDIDPAIRIVDLGAGKLRKALFPLNRYVRAAKPRLIVSPIVGTDALVLLGKALFRWDSKVHISVQNSPSASAGVSQDAIARHWPTLIRTLYRFAASINGISEGVAQDVERIMKRPAGSVPVINNPVDIASVQEKAASEPEYAWLRDKKAPVLLAVGRLVRQKDVPTLLKAFALLRKERDARLIILGEGPDRPALEALAATLGISDDLLMPGFSSNPFSAMAASDVFVLSSRWEGFANVVAEALACGTKVVSTDCPSGPAEILENGRHGTLVPIGDEAALARAMGEAIDSKIDPAQLRERAADFSLDRIAESYRQLFQARGLI